ncbi:S8 family serine peptidase [Micromonospora sp. CPCC 205371]|nr:S8 family serine peptidase [Micromonospora sp. CPCC 205371]
MRSSPGSVVAAVLVGLWAVGVTVVTQALGWLIDQVLLVSGLATPAWMWPFIGVVNAVLVGVPAALLAAIPQGTAVRSAGRAWLIGAVALGGLGLLRAVPMPQNEIYLASLTLLALVGAVVLRQPRPEISLPAVAGGLAMLLPWFWTGALGGALETSVAVAAAVAVGWFAASVLDGAYQGVFVSGLVGGVALLLIAAGIGQSGAQLAAMLVLPPLGFAAAALRQTWALVALAAVGPLAFVDPEEISLLLSTGRDQPVWSAIAAACSLAIAVLLAILYASTRGLRPRRSVAAVATVVVALAGGAVYIGLGQPGLYGERLFVIMKSQADLGGITGIRDARVTEVHRRLVTHAEQTQADLRADLDRWHVDYTPYYLVNAVEVSGGPAVRRWLSLRDDVDRVLLSQQLRPLPAEQGVQHGDDAAPATPPWNITMLGADRVASQLGVTGSGIVVGTSDSGVDGQHPALSGGYRGGADSWFDPWNGTRTPNDRAGHGTHTLGSAVGRTVGVAPGAQWVACANLDRNLGNPARYLDCMQFMLAPFPLGGDPFADGRPERAPHVLTNSWGCPPIEGCDTGALTAATAAFEAAGVFFVAAAGNTGPYCESIDDPPAPYADVLTVGAVDEDRAVTDFSSRGPGSTGTSKPDVVAPGNDVLSAMPGGGYARQSGTSMATPHVAGVVALMWSANPALVGNLARTRQILRDTATGATLGDDTDDCGDPANLTGAGLVDAYAAVRAAQAAR